MTRTDNTPNSNGRLAIGLMSGTSLDGVDAVVIEQAGQQIKTLGHTSITMPGPLRESLLALSTQSSFEADPIEMLGRARLALSDLYAQTVGQLPAKLTKQAVVIGAHGQTIRHHPELGFSLQLLDGARLAAKSGVPVVCDLRSADLAAGGQGAPLVPVFHAAAFGSALKPSNQSPAAIVNIGGIANVSIIGSDGLVMAGFDTGPGNRLIDDWCQQHRNESFDRDGQWAQTGTIDQVLLDRLLTQSYFRAEPPKSTGRELFNAQWLREMIRGGNTAPADVQATLVELTALTIGDAVSRFHPAQLLVCGGGAFNGFLMQRIGATIAPVQVTSTASVGIEPDHVEAAAFAWLALQRIDEIPVRLSGSTGARYDSVSGALHLPPPQN